MPVRNEESFIEASISSILKQTLTKWELIVVDDGSSDATPDLLANAAHKDSRISIITKVGEGLVTALNEGLAACSAPLIARMDGDDISHPRRLELQADFLNHNPGIDLVACSFRHFPKRNIKDGMAAYEAWQNTLLNHDLIMRDICVESPFVHPSVMMRKERIVALNGYRDCGWPEDYDLWLRMALAGNLFSRIPQTLFFWRDHPERATRTMDEYSLIAFRKCKLDYLKNEFLYNCTDIVIAGTGAEGRAWQRLLQTIGVSVTHWMDVDPKKIGKSLHGATIFHPNYFIHKHIKMLIAIGVRGAREEFRTFSKMAGWSEGVDFICVS